MDGKHSELWRMKMSWSKILSEPITKKDIRDKFDYYQSIVPSIDDEVEDED